MQKKQETIAKIKKSKAGSLGLLAWPFVTGSLFGSLSSPTTAITDMASRALLATDFAPAPMCLYSLVPKRAKGYLLDLPSSGMPETGAREEVPGEWERFAAPRKGRFSPGQVWRCPRGICSPGLSFS